MSAPTPPALKRVGHKGAHAVVPGNTFESFSTALEAGVDMIEFDVLRLEDGRLVLAHDFEDAVGRAPLALEEGLDHLAAAPYAGLEFNVDIKLPGYEAEVVDGLGRHGLLARALVSTAWPVSLAELGRLAPGLRRGWSVPRVRRDYTKQRATVLPAHVLLAYGRAVLPRRAERMLGERRCEAVMAYHRLVTPALVAAVSRARGQLYAWTVDEAERICRLAALGVDGVITNDPRLFRTLPSVSPGPSAG